MNYGFGNFIHVEVLLTTFGIEFFGDARDIQPQIRERRFAD